MNGARVRRLPAAAALGAAVLLGGCAVGVGVDGGGYYGDGGYAGGYYEPYGYNYGGWGGHYHVGPPRGGPRPGPGGGPRPGGGGPGGGHGGGGRAAPSIPGRPR